MSGIPMSKHHGLGNDFCVLLHERSLAEVVTPEQRSRLARRVCDRRRGIGADGLIFGDPEPDGSVRMDLYNADGSRAETSGNGLRCLANAVLVERGLPAGTDVAVLTAAGPTVVCTAPGDETGTIDAQVWMGPITPIAAPRSWPALGCDPMRPVAHLSLGNPHSVVAVDDVHAVDLADLGGRVASVNLEIVEPGPGPHEVTMRVHERGAGITAACGTGACATASAAVGWGLAAPDPDELVTVYMDGGSARVRLHDGGATLIGPAALIATIVWEGTRA